MVNVLQRIDRCLGTHPQVKIIDRRSRGWFDVEYAITPVGIFPYSRERYGYLDTYFKVLNTFMDELVPDISPHRRQRFDIVGDPRAYYVLFGTLVYFDEIGSISTTTRTDKQTLITDEDILKDGELLSKMGFAGGRKIDSATQKDESALRRDIEIYVYPGEEFLTGTGFHQHHSNLMYLYEFLDRVLKTPLSLSQSSGSYAHLMRL